MQDALDKINELLDPDYTGSSMRFWRGNPIGNSAELQRISDLPRRLIDVADPTPARIWTNLLRRENPSCNCQKEFGEACITSLRPVQGWALQEAFEHDGFIGSIGVGKGKTGIDILLPMAFQGVERAVVLIPASLRPQFLSDWARWSKHFKTPNLVGGSEFVAGRPAVYVVPYSTLSQTENTDLLRRINPQLIVGDEAQSLKNPTAARTVRFLRIFQTRDESGEKIRRRYAAHSGTFTTKSPKDFSHHCALALRLGSPAPVDPAVLEEFDSALGELPQGNSHPGQLLKRMAAPGEVDELRKDLGDDDTTIARMVFAKRFRETPGVVVTIDGRPLLEDTQEPIALRISQRRVLLPSTPLDVPGLQERLRGATLAEIIADVRQKEERPDGEELLEAIELYRCLRELSSGLFYRWRFPRREAPDVIDLWLKRRKAWAREIRGFLSDPQPFGDSESWAVKAAMRWHFGFRHEGKDYPAKLRRSPLPVFEAAHLLPWLEVEESVHPVPAVVWLHSFLVDDCVAWLKEHPTKGIVWYEHTALGDEIYRKAREQGLDVPQFKGGEKASIEIKKERGERSIIASMRAHGTGKNLQRFTHGLMANPASDGAAWEQNLGRWHRDGQTAPVVYADVYRHTELYQSAIDSAIGKAKYIQQMMGSEQRLCYAEIDWAID